MIFDILKEIGTYEKENEYSICFNGALIVENKNHRILNFESILFEDAKELFNLSLIHILLFYQHH